MEDLVLSEIKRFFQVEPTLSLIEIELLVHDGLIR